LETTVSRHTLRFGGPSRRPDLLPAAGTDPRLWLHRDRRNHMAILRLAEAHEAHESVWMLARSAWRIWFLAAEYDDLIEAHQSGLAAARSAGDEHAIAIMTNYLSSGLYRVGRVREAAEMLTTAHGTFLKLGDRVAANIVLSNIAVVRLALGEIDAAEASAQEALIQARRSDDLGLVGTQLNSLGSVQNRRGNLERCLELHRRELLVAVETGAHSMRYLALGNVAITRMRLGHRPAERLLRLAIALNTRIGRPSSVAESTSSLGVLRRRQERFAEAIEHHRAALDIADRLPDRRLVAHLRIEFGDTLLAAGDPAGAAAQFEQAVALARTSQARLEEARGLSGLAAAVTDPVAAVRHRHRAAAMFREMNVPNGVHASV
jgi:tetratricopeptide (TPR) repeat protein